MRKANHLRRVVRHPCWLPPAPRHAEHRDRDVGHTTALFGSRAMRQGHPWCFAAATPLLGGASCPPEHVRHAREHHEWPQACRAGAGAVLVCASVGGGGGTPKLRCVLSAWRWRENVRTCTACTVLHRVRTVGRGPLRRGAPLAWRCAGATQLGQWPCGDGTNLVDGRR